jgi:hypothetical protein
VPEPLVLKDDKNTMEVVEMAQKMLARENRHGSSAARASFAGFSRALSRSDGAVNCLNDRAKASI